MIRTIMHKYYNKKSHGNNKVKYKETANSCSYQLSVKKTLSEYNLCESLCK